jgi:hypothetical protein
MICSREHCPKENPESTSTRVEYAINQAIRRQRRIVEGAGL